jgi:glutamyl-tRNA synthetase
VFGHLRDAHGSLATDPVLLKSDGYPTYHLANVVDDHSMGITHVFRGEEWITSLPLHLDIYSALGLEPPQFAHIPILRNSDGTKMSKRNGDVKVEDYIVGSVVQMPRTASNVSGRVGAGSVLRSSIGSPFLGGGQPM